MTDAQQWIDEHVPPEYLDDPLVQAMVADLLAAEADGRKAAVTMLKVAIHDYTCCGEEVQP